MAASNQARARRGWSNTAVSETSSWAIENAPVEPGPAVLDGERVGHHRHHPPQQVPHVAGAEAGADAVGRDGVGDRAQPVVEGLEADAGLGQLALGPLVPVGAAHSGYGAYEHSLMNAGPHSASEKYKYQWSGTDDWRRQAIVGMAWAGGRRGSRRRSPATTRSAPGPCRPAPARGDLRRRPRPGYGRAMSSLHSPRRKRTTGTPDDDDQVVELGDQPIVVAVQRGRGGDVVAPLEQEPHHPTLVLQAGDVAPDPDAVHRGAAEADVLGQ